MAGSIILKTQCVQMKKFVRPIAQRLKNLQRTHVKAARCKVCLLATTARYTQDRVAPFLTFHIKTRTIRGTNRSFRVYPRYHRPLRTERTENTHATEQALSASQNSLSAPFSTFRRLHNRIFRTFGPSGTTIGPSETHYITHGSHDSIVFSISLSVPLEAWSQQV